tara:strand:- start:4453 stop:6807 length:2355 start_codon:yes stop_codon:yes gene_type:complete
MKYFYIIIFISGLLLSQSRIQEWKAYTSPLHINDLTEYNDLIICATNGGLLLYDKNKKNFTTLTVVDQLVSTGVNIIEVENDSSIWLGGLSPDGFIQVYDLKNNLSISKFDFDLTEIIDISIADSICFIAFIDNQDWGVMEFIVSDNKWIYRDIYRNWPINFDSINSIEISGDKILVGTSQGLLIGNWKESNLKDPGNWQQFQIELFGEVRLIESNINNVLLLYNNGIYVLNLGQEISLEIIWNYLDPSEQLIEVIKDSEGIFWGILANKIIRLNLTGIEWSLNTENNYSFTSLSGLSKDKLYIGSELGIMVLDKDTKVIDHEIPNAPLTNQISALTILNDGRLVAGSKFGISIKESWGWRNITEGDEINISSSFNPQRYAVDYLPINFGGFISDLEQGPDGLLYCAIRGTYPEPRRHGGGIVIIDIDNIENFTLIDTAYLDYYADEYMIVKDIEFDQLGVMWAANTYSTTRRSPIALKDMNNVWGSINLASSNNLLSYTPNTIAFDSFNRVWIGSFEDDLNSPPAKNGGLVFMYYEGSILEPSSTEWGQVDINPGYNNNTVWSLVINDEDILYILTPIGLKQITLQYSNSNPIKRYGYTYFPNISFGKGSKLNIDSRNNIWASSPTDGIHILTEASTYWPSIDGINEKNSQLLSNVVSDIAFDNDEGIAYISTNKGISVLRIPFSKPKENFNKIKIFPSPFSLPNSSPLVIDGLMDGAECKVLTITGKVLRTLNASNKGINGYQAFWDGKDEQGRWVSTGVYLISFTEIKGNYGFEKIAVIKN